MALTQTVEDSPFFMADKKSPTSTNFQIPKYRFMKLDKLITTLTAIFSLSGVQAANDPVEDAPVRVSEVTFTSGYAVLNDDTSEMPTPHWIDEVNNADPADTFPDGNPDDDKAKTKPNNVKSYAYSYHKNQIPEVEAIFKWKNGIAPPEGSPYSAMGVVTDTANSTFVLRKKVLLLDTIYTFELANTTIVNDDRIQAYLTNNRKVERKNTVGYDIAKDLKPLKIRWSVFDRYGKLVGISDSTHTIYVTWAESISAYKQETLFNLSCSAMSNQSLFDIVSGGVDVIKSYELLFQDFEDRQVKRMDGEVLSYYKNWDIPYIITRDLIMFKDGQCGSWAALFLDCNKVQGINSVNSYIEFRPKNSKEDMLVSNWQFVGTGGSSDPLYPYLNIHAAHKFVHDKTKFTFSFAQVIDLKGIGGQNNENPKSVFSNHQVSIGGKYYDPSYGVKYRSLNDFESNVDGFMVDKPWDSYDETTFPAGTDINENGSTTDLTAAGVPYFIRKNDSSVVDIIEINKGTY